MNNSVMRCQWRHLLFLHWETEARALQRLLPRGLTLDTFENRAFIGLVPFTMRGVKPHWIPTPPLVQPMTRRLWEDFHETNVRTYVLGPDGAPGVWFFSLDAASAAGAFAGRAWFRLPYFHAAMRLRRLQNRAYEYSTRRLYTAPREASCLVRALPHGETFAAENGTLPHFLVERYALYAAKTHRGKTQLWRGQVHHAPYELQNAHVLRCRETLIAAAGVHHENTPPMALYSAGVDVEVSPLERL